jgi:signal transduction histidine kinase
MSAGRGCSWAAVLAGALLALAGGGGLFVGSRHLASKAGLLILGGVLLAAGIAWLVRYRAIIDDVRPMIMRRSGGIAVAVVLFAATAAMLVMVGGSARRTVTSPGELALAAVGFGALALRNRPGAAFTVTVAVVLGEGVLRQPSLAGLPLLIAAGTLAARAGWRRALGASAVAVATLIAAVPLAGQSLSLESVMVRAVLGALAGVSGLYLTSVWTARAHAAEARRRQLQAQELRVEQAVAEERVRIARELHDIVAHNVSLVILQAEAARSTLGPDARVAPMLEAAVGAGRAALEEMRRMTGVLRLGDVVAETDRAPQPGLADLDALAEQARAAGLNVTLVGDAQEIELPPGVDLSAYRIVQEALTNTIKHAHTGHVRVEVRRTRDTVELCIADDGRPSGPGSTGETAADRTTGHGLIGMRERTALLGGSLSAGPGPDGGWIVRASLPAGRP